MNYDSHNPYFNRWFSAIKSSIISPPYHIIVTILILIDGFLQYKEDKIITSYNLVTILILIDGFLQSGMIPAGVGAEAVTILILIDGFLQ